jgi:hypothetical protein
VGDQQILRSEGCEFDPRGGLVIFAISLSVKQLDMVFQPMTIDSLSEHCEIVWDLSSGISQRQYLFLHLRSYEDVSMLVVDSS